MLTAFILTAAGAALAPAAVSSPREDDFFLGSVSTPGTLRLVPVKGPWALEVEAGALWTQRNDIRVPGDSGTAFSLADLTGEGAWPVGRMTVEYDLNERHGLRLLYAPIRTDGFGDLRGPTSFDGTAFAPGRAEGRYKFNTYRLGWRYRFHQSARWTWRAGATILVRDAALEVRQGTTRARNTNVGVVPLLNLTGEWRFADRWSGILDVEGAGAPQGRAVDASLKLAYDLRPGLQLAAGYRTIEGGADNDEVFTFSWINQAVVSLRWEL